MSAFAQYNFDSFQIIMSKQSSGGPGMRAPKPADEEEDN